MVDEAQPRKNYAIMRFGKIRSWATLRLVEGHNTRKVKSENLINDTPPKELLEAGGDDFVLLAEQRMEELGIPKPSAQGKILAVEAITSASRKWFEDATEKQKDEWIARNVAWAREKFGRGLLSAKLHLDEEVWHIHFIAIPAVEKAPKKRGRPFKDAEAKAASDVLWKSKAKRWTLAYEDLLGGHRMNLSREQDRYHATVADLGLERGEKSPEVIEIELGDELTIALAEWQKGQPRKNIPPQEYRKLIKKLHEEAEAAAARAKLREQELDQREAGIVQRESDVAQRKKDTDADRIAAKEARDAAEAAAVRAREQEAENLRIRGELSQSEDDLSRRKKDVDAKAASVQNDVEIHKAQLEIIAGALDPASPIKLYFRDEMPQTEGIGHGNKGVGASWDWVTGGITALAKRLTHLIDREAAVQGRERVSEAVELAANQALADAAKEKEALETDRAALGAERTQLRQQAEIVRKVMDPNGGIRLEMEGADVRGVGLNGEENAVLRSAPSWFKSGLRRIAAGLRSIADRTASLDRRQASLDQRERETKAKAEEGDRRLQTLEASQVQLDENWDAIGRTRELAIGFIAAWKKIPASERSPNIQEALEAATALSLEDLPPGYVQRGQGGRGH